MWRNIMWRRVLQADKTFISPACSDIASPPRSFSSATLGQQKSCHFCQNKSQKLSILPKFTWPLHRYPSKKENQQRGLSYPTVIRWTIELVVTSKVFPISKPSTVKTRTCHLPLLTDARRDDLNRLVIVDYSSKLSR